MGMSTHVIGIAPPDETWKKMKAIFDACEEAGVKVPGDVMKFFNHENPDPDGVKIEIKGEKWSDDGASGIQIDLKTLPAHVRYVRFYNAW